MVRPPSVSGEDVIRALSRLGFSVVRQRGSHVILRKDTEAGAIGCSVPAHKELAFGTLRGVLKQAGISIEEFLKSL
ncbi:MAG TPA: type II toxin-antitoxin system HicA family toxin [Thermoanaerobaculia bacterium]|nr:type II toxin-antitoxin system HicA family toxin [Thermoanaerobaculia bacterium]